MNSMRDRRKKLCNIWGKEDGVVINGNGDDNNEEKINMSMGRKRKAELNPETMEHVRKAAEGYVRRMQSGEKVGLSTVAEDTMSAMLELERKMFPGDVPRPGERFLFEDLPAGHRQAPPEGTKGKDRAGLRWAQASAGLLGQRRRGEQGLLVRRVPGPDIQGTEEGADVRY